MASRGLLFDTVDVFTTERFLGNPLGIVHVPQGYKIEQEEKQRIAQEFNLSETVFLHAPAAGAADGEVQCDIFLVKSEVPWAGHPVIGASWFLASKLKNLESGILHTKAGPVHFSMSTNAAGARISEMEVPMALHVHQQAWSVERLLTFQPSLSAQATEMQGQSFPVVAIVEGVQFVLIRLSSRKLLSDVQVTGTAPSKLTNLDPGRGGFLGALFYFVEPQENNHGIEKVHSRMIEGTFEDPATGSASSALTAWLAMENWKQHGHKSYKVQIEQGKDMGRKSDIGMSASLDDTGTVKKLLLSGSSVHVMSGHLA